MTNQLDEMIQSTREWFKENAKRFAFKKLEREIIKKEICVECGTCVSVCPVNAISGEWQDARYVPKLTGDCVACGLCYAFCPRTFSLDDELLGRVRDVYQVRSMLENVRRQNGGAATSFLRYLLQEKLIDAAIVAIPGNNKWRPVSSIITSPDDLQGGTFYSHIPMTTSLMEAISKGHKRIAIVGTSCNIDALEKIQSRPAGVLARSKDLEVLRLGLFCMDSFNYSKLVDFLRENSIEIDSVKRFEISKGKLRAETDAGSFEWPIADLEHLMNKSCHYCYDLTSMNADVSFGNIGSEDDWTTVIVRTKRGADLFNRMLESKTVEYEKLEQKAVFVIEKIARMKMKRRYSK